MLISVFSINSLLKTSRPGKHLACIEFPAYAPDVSLCIVKHLQHYLKRADILRGDVKQLFISYAKPHKAVSPTFLLPQLWKVLGGPRSPHLQSFMTNQWPLERILGLNSLKLYVGTTKIVSYGCMFWWLREHIIKAHSCWYRSLLFIWVRTHTALNLTWLRSDQWPMTKPNTKIKRGLPVRWSLIWVLWVIGRERRSHVPNRVIFTHPCLGVSAHIC